MAKDYYRILGVRRDATAEEIKQAYRRLAFQYHPDKNPDDPVAAERFREINEAYGVLGNPAQRREYDARLGLFKFSARSTTRGGPSERDAQSSTFDKLNQIFESIFERGRRHTEGMGPIRGKDVTQEVYFSVSELVEGCQKRIQVRYPVPCRYCNGRGIPPNAQVRVCSQCRGTGSISVPQGKFLTQQVCPACSGRGRLASEQCSHCHGTGERSLAREIRIKVPAGSKDGMRLRFRGEGQPGLYGGPPGDLYIVIRVEPHRFLKRRGDDVHCEVTIGFKEAILGTTLKITTLDGQAKLVIPPGTQPGQVFKLRGLGFPRSNGLGRGDQFVRVKVTLPKTLTEEQRRLIEQF